MAVFSLQKIAAAAAGHPVYLRGVALYNGGCVHHAERTRGGVYEEIVTADVSDDRRQGTYHCEACFDFDGKLSHTMCSCPTFDARHGACKHLVAMLVYKYYTDMVSGSSAAPKVTAAVSPHVTDDIAARMLSRYMDRETAQLAAQTAAPDEPIRLLPHLRINGHAAAVSFSIAAKRDYVLRDLRAFVHAVEENETVSYGKDFSFFHHPDSFDKNDRALLRFMSGQIPPVPRGTVGGHALRELMLAPVSLDAFLSLMRDRTVTCLHNGRELQTTVRRADPSITLTVEKTDTGCFLIADGDLCTLAGSRRRYVLCDGVLYACSTAFCERMIPLLDALQASHGRLFVADRDLPTLCTGTLKAVGGYLTLEGDVQALEAYLPGTFEAEMYLDSHGRDTLVGKLQFCYGDRRVTAFTDEVLDGVVRDTLAEYRLCLIARSLFSAVDEHDGRLTLTGGDETLYKFLTDGLVSLQQHATVYATDAVRDMSRLTPPRISVGVRMQNDLLDLEVDADGIDRAELAAILTSYREKKTYHRLKDGRFLPLSDPSLQGLYALTEGLSVSRTALQSGQISLPTYRALYLDKVLRDNPAVRLRRDEGFRRLVRDVSTVADSEFSPPASLDGVLRNYQKTGFRWLKTMQEYSFGGILADDMGLGKTVQMISLLLDAKEHGETLPSLVVCPASLIYNWQNEFARFAPTMRVRPIVGDRDAREALLDDLTQVDVVLTSYDLLRRDADLYKAHVFAYHILDEAQYIKNAQTQAARSNKAVQSRQRFALTGTPIENRLSELWSIFDFLMPGFLYSYARFRDRFERPIVHDGDEAALDRLDKLVSPFIMRRLKKDVLKELPDKHEAVVRVPLAGEQHQLYRANVQVLTDELKEHGLARNHITVLAMLTRLRQICCSPSLCYEDYAGDSAKIDVCLELLRQAADGGHKVLLFSQFTSLLDMLAARLEKEGVAFYDLRGSTPKEKRAELVDAFNKDDTPVFLISLKAGGTGLNLTGADTVIHFDPWWNVSAQNQATDRAHRIGQTHTVQVYKLIASDTIEEKILMLQERKAALADAVVHRGDGLLGGLDVNEWLSLLEE